MEIDVQTTRQSVRPLHGLWKAGEAPRAAKPAMCAKTRETVPPWRGWPDTAEPRRGRDPHARKQWFTSRDRWKKFGKRGVRIWVAR